jgi:hypothetical protein
MPDAKPSGPASGSRGATIRRRFVLAALGGGVIAGSIPSGGWAAAVPRAEPFPDAVKLLVAGPEGGRLARWTASLSPLLARHLPPGTIISTEAGGGADGVTAANQFEVRVPPDGATALVLPGEAALAWLAGDPRARFDAAHWVPVMAGISSAVLVSRLPPEALPRGARLHIAASTPTGPEMSALLAADLLGLDPVPVAHTGAAEATALRSGAVDAVLLRGPSAATQAISMRAAGGRPLFALGVPDASGEVARDPFFPDLPTLPEYAARWRGMVLHGSLFDGWRAAAMAAQLEFGLVLPQLTPAAMVALWRLAGAQTAETPELVAALGDGVRALATPAATGRMATLAADADALRELRRWLLTRFNWQPS